MSGKVVGLVAAAALLASVGVANAADHATANAKGPVKLTDNQFDKVTAGAATNQVAFLTAISAVDVTRLLAISIFTLGFLNGVPQAPARAHALTYRRARGAGKGQAEAAMAEYRRLNSPTAESEPTFANAVHQLDASDRDRCVPRFQCNNAM